MTAAIKTGLGIKAKAGGGTIPYIVNGTLVYTEARDLMLATAPALFNDAPLSNYEISMTDWKLWLGSVEYAIPQTKPEEKDGRLYRSYDTSGGTVHINQSLETVGAYCLPCMRSKPSLYVWNGTSWTTSGGIIGTFETGCTEDAPAVPTSPAPTTGDKAYGILKVMASPPPGYTAPIAPWTGGAINITKDGIEGADIPSAQSKFTLTLYLDTVTPTQRLQLEAITQHVNAVSFEGRAVGEVRFENFTINNQGRQNYELRMNFIREPNLTGLQVGGIKNIAKKGHELLWVYYQEYLDEISHTMLKRPVYAYVERVFYWSNFAVILELIALATAAENEA